MNKIIELIIVMISGCSFLWKIRKPKWYFKFPFLPIPPKEYTKWRLETAYGLGATWKNILWRDIKSFLLWRKDMMRKIK